MVSAVVIEFSGNALSAALGGRYVTRSHNENCCCFRDF